MLFSRRPYRAYGLRAVLSLCLLGWCLGAVACDRTCTKVCVDDPDNSQIPDCNYFASLQVVGSRFEFPPLPNPAPGASPLALQQSQDFWLRAGDQLQVSFDEYNVLARKPGAQCDPNNPSPNEPQDDCTKTWACDYEKTNRDAPGALPLRFAPALEPVLIAFQGFMPPYEEVGTLRISVQEGCQTAVSLQGGSPQVLHNPFVFTPANSATFILKNYAPSVDDLSALDQFNTLTEAKVFVTEENARRTVPYPLMPLAQNLTDTTFYSGTVPGFPVLSDNFSPNLHISKVQVLKGQPDTDPVTGKLRVKDSSPARPSRIILIPNYQGDSVYQHDSTRCYAGQAGDGDFDLKRCRRSLGVDCNDLMNPTCFLPATPTYLATDPTQLLTWVAEFKISEGADFDPTTPALDPVPANAVLFIEFTIEAN